MMWQNKRRKPAQAPADLDSVLPPASRLRLGFYSSFLFSFSFSLLYLPLRGEGVVTPGLRACTSHSSFLITLFIPVTDKSTPSGAPSSLCSATVPSFTGYDVHDPRA